MAGESTGSGPVWEEPTKKDRPPKDADLKTCWAFLRVGVEHIMTKLHTGMTYSYYILLYTVIYDFCTTAAKPVGGFNTGRGGAQLQGADLYRSLHQYMSEHCKALRDECSSLSDIELLKYYAKKWETYTLGAAYVNKLFNYLNKHWVKREKDEGRKEVYTVYTASWNPFKTSLALVAWKHNFFSHFSKNGDVSQLTQALLRQIEAQRNGEDVDQTLMKAIIKSYVLLGIDESDAQRQVLAVYNEFFQAPFLTSTEKYYRAESAAFVENNSVSDYLRRADGRIDEEMKRVDMYLHDSTRKDLRDVCEKTLIAEHKALMVEEFQNLLDLDRTEDLGRMYGLLSRITNGLEDLRNKFEQHVRKAGMAAVEKVIPAPGAVTEAGKPEVLDPKAYVEALLGVHAKYNDFVNGPFRAELGFNASLDRACRAFCNSNPACSSPTKSPELLANYVDQLLKKTNKDLDADALEAALSQAMEIFKFIDDKDVFQKFYQKKLATRLVSGSSASDDSESSMITKLKEICGFDYTNKLQKMFTDVNLSRDITERFKESERSKGNSSDMDFSIQVLGSNNWPMAPNTSDYSVPGQIQTAYDRFTRFHSEVHNGRKLTWLWNYSKAEIRTTYLAQKYILQVSTYQLAILLFFNESDTCTFKEIQEGTRITEVLLRNYLVPMVKLKVLLQDGDNYDLNLNFKSKKIRVNLNMPARAEQKAEAQEVLQAVDEDRKFVYQATIVRLMKGRKTLKHQALIQEVTSQISTKFTPKIPEIKKAIDHLLDKEYIERAADSNDTYNYVA